LLHEPPPGSDGLRDAYVAGSLYSLVVITAILESVLIAIAAPLARFIVDKCRRYAVLIANDV